MEKVAETELTLDDIKSQGITAANWGRAQELGFSYYGNVAAGSFSDFTTMQARGFDVRLGPPMGPDGPLETTTEAQKARVERGVYVLAPSEL